MTHPSKLDLYITGFKYSQLEGIMHINITSLDSLHVDWCPSLRAFPECLLPAPLETLQLYHCQNLESLPEGLSKLTRLKRMDIKECDSLVSFPDEGLPSSLVSLNIASCEKLNLMPLSNWRLHELTSLKELTVRVGCPDFVSFPEWLLPTSLTSFSITELPNLGTLSIGLQNLTSLEKLQIKHCPKIKFLPQEELLAGLLVLIMRDCPMLEEWHEKQKREDWAKIAHIHVTTTVSAREHYYITPEEEEEEEEEEEN